MHPDYSYLFQDQFAFRLTGSTITALIYLLHTLMELFQTNDYVHVIALDFSKASDSVNHYSLVSKLANFTLPEYLHNWMVNNLSGRQHQTKLDDNVSQTLPINASIIKGSALGPVDTFLQPPTYIPSLLPTYFANMLMTLTSWSHLLTRHLYYKSSNIYRIGLQLIT